ncbi:MAG: type II toxin-antitoxin system HicA family toxin [Chloroflexi bacterium]|nr:type II toxin-antitoxin system HicA family toxin [Chloroflexota bacterium]
MKRWDLIKLFEKNGWWFLRAGGNHDIYTNGKDIESISRQKEIKEPVAKAIINRRKLKK